MRRGSIALVACLALLAAVGSTTPVRAQADPDMDEVTLSLGDSLRTALENNLSLVAARVDPAISEQNVIFEDSAFDLSLDAGYSHFELEQEISNLFSLNQQTSDSLDVGISQQLRFGADYRIELQNNKTDATGPLVTAPSSYDARLAMNFTLPLLRGFGKETTTERLMLAEGNLDISRATLRRNAEETIKAVEDAYWTVAAAREAVRIAELSRTRAKDLLELNRKKVEVGTLAPIEITQAEAGVAAEEEGVIVARADLLDAEDELRRLLGVPESDVMWTQRIVPTTDPVRDEVLIDRDEAMLVAFAERPELASARQTLRNRELSERVTKKAKRPGLDFVASFRPAGNNFTTIIDPGPDMIPGTPDDTTITDSDGSLGSAIQEIPDLDNYDWSVGLNFSYPIGNRAAKANFAIATLNRERAEADLDDLEQTVRVGIRRAVRQVESGFQRVEAARVNVRLQQEKLDAEQKKFDNGMSTSFEVLTFQNDLADAELALIRAMLDYNRALAGLELAKGTLLQARGLTLED